MEVEVVDVGEAPHQALVEEALHGLLAEALDVHRAARGEVAEGLLDLCRAGAIGAAHLHLAGGLHDRRVARRAALRHDEGALRARALLRERPHDLRDHVAGPLHDDPVADQEALAGHVLLVVKGREPHGRAPDRDRLEDGERHEGPGPPHADHDVAQGRDRRRRGELVGDRPAGCPSDGSEPLLDSDLVDLDHRAVDVEVDRAPALLPALALGLHRLDVVQDGDVRVHPEAGLAQPRQRRGVARQVQTVAVADAVAPDRQGPAGRHRRVHLAQAPRRRVARVGEGGQALLGAGGVEVGEGRQRQVDLSAHLDHARGRRSARQPQARGDRADRAQVGRHVLADDAVAAGGPRHEEPVLVDQRDGEPVDLGLHHEAHVAAPQALLLHHRPGAAVPGVELVGAARVGQAEHGAAVLDRREAARQRGAHALGGRVGCDQVRVGGLEGLQLAEPVVVGDVLDARVVEHVVAVVRVVQERPQLRDPLSRRAHAGRPRARAGTSEGAPAACRRRRRGPRR